MITQLSEITFTASIDTATKLFTISVDNIPPHISLSFPITEAPVEPQEPPEPVAKEPWYTWYYTIPLNVDAVAIKPHRFKLVIGDQSEQRLTWLQAMRDNGFEGLALRYIVVCQTQNPHGGTPLRNQWTYKPTDWAEIDAHEDMFLHSATPISRSNRITSSPDWYYMDPKSPTWIAWVVQRVAEMLAEALQGWEGIFLDNEEGSWWKPYNASGQHLYGGDGRLIATSEEYVQRVLTFLAALRAALGPDVSLWANMISMNNYGYKYERFMALSGMMNEAGVGWFTTYLPIAQQGWVLKQLKKCLDNGKGVVFVGQGSPTDETKAKYAWAMYMMLVPADPSTANFTFRWANSGNYTLWTEFPWFAHTLGNPIGDYFDRTDGVDGWGRLFEHGEIRINGSTHTVEVIYND